MDEGGEKEGEKQEMWEKMVKEGHGDYFTVLEVYMRILMEVRE